MQVQLLGRVSVVDDDADLNVGGPKQRAVLASLAVDPGSAVTTDSLSYAVWGDLQPGKAKRSLATYVSNLRQTFGDAIVSVSDGYQLRVERSSVDACVFSDGVRALRNVETTNEDDLLALARLWRGTPFGGIEVFESLAVEASRLEAERVELSEAVARAALQNGATASTVAELQVLVRDNPDRETLRELFIRALYEDGRQTTALSEFRRYETYLREELGLEPTPRLRELEVQILNHSSPATELPEPTENRGGAGPPERFSSFHGREAVVEHVAGEATRKRLVTVVGPGGIGKSSVCVQALRAVSKKKPIAFVEASRLTDQDPWRVAAEVYGFQPDADADARTMVLAHLEQSSSVLCIDGCDDVRSDLLADFVTELLGAARTLHVLASSRQPLDVQGESIARLSGISDSEALDLLIERAGLDWEALDAGSRDQLGAIAAAMDGIPLATELTASRLSYASPDVLLESITDTEHASSVGLEPVLRNALERSVGGLDESANSAFLSVCSFEGRFDLALLLEIVPDGPLRRIKDLVDAALVEPPNRLGQYRILRPIQQFGRYLAAQQGVSGELRQEHREAVAAWSELQYEKLWTKDAPIATAAIRRNRGEYLSALRSSRVDGDTITRDRLFGALGREYVQKLMWPVLLEHAVAIAEDAQIDPTAADPISVANAAFTLNQANRPSEAIAAIDHASSAADQATNSYALGRVRDRQAQILGSNLLISLHDLIEMCEEAEELMSSAGAPDARSALDNAAFSKAFKGDADASEYLAAQEDWYLATTGSPNPFLSHMRCEVLGRSHDYQGILELTDVASEIAMELGDLGSARDLFVERAFAAFTVNEPQTTAEAADMVREIDRITGTSYVWNSAAHIASAALNDHVDGLTETRSFCARFIQDRTYDDDELNAKEQLLGGTPWASRHFARMLLPIALVFERSGRHEASAALAAFAPAVISEYDAQLFGGKERWNAIASKTQEPPLTTLRQLFDYICMVASAAAD